jgi:hypothetical protein
VSESEYWELLRFRINCLPTTAGRPALPGYCDWFEPRRYVLDGPSPRITGRVGFVSGRNAWQRPFALLVGRPVGSSSEVEWATLLPQRNRMHGCRSTSPSWRLIRVAEQPNLADYPTLCRVALRVLTEGGRFDLLRARSQHRVG